MITRLPSQEESISQAKGARMDKSIKTTNKVEKENIISKMRTLLVKQAGILNKYVELAELEKQAVSANDTEKLLYYTELEASFIKKVEAYNKTIQSFFDLYPELSDKKNTDIKNLSEQLNSLQVKLKFLNKENREAIQKKLIELQKEIEEISKKKRDKPSPYKKIGNPSFIDTSA